MPSSQRSSKHLKHKLPFFGIVGAPTFCKCFASSRSHERTDQTPVIPNPPEVGGVRFCLPSRVLCAMNPSWVPARSNGGISRAKTALEMTAHGGKNPARTQRTLFQFRIVGAPTISTPTLFPAAPHPRTPLVAPPVCSRYAPAVRHAN